MTLPRSFDYIVIGAGSTGSVVAARLSEDPECSVLLLEAGGTDLRDEVQDPVRWPTLFPGELDWGYSSQPMKHCGNRIDHVPRAKMLGGCHSHNASAWVRGHRSDFDGWLAEGCVGWGWEDVLPLYRRIEDWQGPASDLRGTGGPMYVTPPVSPNPVAAAFARSGPEIGLPAVVDNNGPEMQGTSFFNLTIRDGKRFTVVDGYLRPAMSRPNLTVLMHAETHRLQLTGTKCRGVEFFHDGKIQTVTCQREVILSAGVFGTPRILLLSGIGPAGHLQSLNIPVVADLPGVGSNLQDHVLLAGINYECSIPLPPARNNGAEATLWWQSRPHLTAPDIQPVFLEFPFATPELASRLATDNCYAIAPSIVRPQSRGSVTLASADPAAAPVIDVNFMACDADLDAMLAATELCRELGASDAFREFRKREVMPGPLSRSGMQEFVRAAATTYFHPTSTCSMGVGHLSVTAPDLRVHGIQGLRIADASIMPTIPCGNTNAASVMIGEKAFDLLS